MEQITAIKKMLQSITLRDLFRELTRECSCEFITKKIKRNQYHSIENTI